MDGKQEPVRPEYKLRNKYWVALSFEELVAAVEGKKEKEKWAQEVERVKKSYGSISEAYRRKFGI